MKKTIIISTLFILIILLVFPTVVSAKSAQHTFWPEGNSQEPHTYNNIPFQVWGSVGLKVQSQPITSTATYTFPPAFTYYANKVHFIQASIWSCYKPFGTVVAEIEVCYRDAVCATPFQLRIGVNTAEWAYDRPGLNCTGEDTVKPAFSFPYEDPDPNVGSYLGHHYYTSVETDPSRILDNVTLNLIHSNPSDPYVGVAISAITVETDEAPPQIKGGGVMPCKDGNNCTFGLNAYRLEGNAWPTASIFFMDLNEGLTLHANDLRKLGSNASGVYYTLQGWGEVNGEEGYRFVIWSKDNGNPGADNDWIWLRIFKQGVPGPYYETGTGGQFLLNGNIIINTK